LVEVLVEIRYVLVESWDAAWTDLMPNDNQFPSFL